MLPAPKKNFQKIQLFFSIFCCFYRKTAKKQQKIAFCFKTSKWSKIISFCSNDMIANAGES